MFSNLDEPEPKRQSVSATQEAENDESPDKTHNSSPEKSEVAEEEEVKKDLSPAPVANKKKAAAARKGKSVSDKSKEEKTSKNSKKSEKKASQKSEKVSADEKSKAKESLDAFAVKTTSTPEVTPSQGKKRRRKRKLVTKSFVDDDGFMGAIRCSNAFVRAYLIGE